MPVILIISFMLLVLTGVSLVHVLREKGIKLYRWLYGFAAFLIVLVPNVVFKNLPTIFEWTLYVLSGLFAIMFFETTRLMLEHNEMRGIVRSDHFDEGDTKK